VLALLSVFGGLLGWPAVFGGEPWIAAWLAPLVGPLPEMEGHHLALELALMGISTAVALVGFGAAYLLYARRIHPMAHRFASVGATRWLYLRLLGKWHVDTLYDVLVVQPWVWVSRVILYEGLDRRCIDGLVNLVGWLARSVGFLGQLFQSGNIQRYLAIFAVGLALLLFGWLTPLGGHSWVFAQAPSLAASGRR
jgi:NADH-quinone oxidoreductase subunit L